MTSKYTLSGTVFVDGAPYSNNNDNSFVALYEQNPVTGVLINRNLIAYIDQVTGYYSFPSVYPSLFGGYTTVVELSVNLNPTTKSFVVPFTSNTVQDLHYS